MATAKAATEVYDLLILVDATYSMYNYLESLKISLPKVIAISNLTDAFVRVGLLAYRDYSEADRANDGMLEWSGWYDPKTPDPTDVVTAEVLMAAASGLEPIGGGDFPEATKTGLARAYTLMREDATTIILLYTDAPPHCWMVADRDRGSNYHAEYAALSAANSYGGYGPCFLDWVAACNQLHSGPKKAHVYCFLDETIGSCLNSGYYTYLSTVSRGACLSLKSAKPRSIAQVTVDVLLAWMGAEKTGLESITLPANLTRYKNGDNIKLIKNEKDPIANPYFWAHNPAGPGMRLQKVAEETKARVAMAANIAEVQVDSDVLKKYLPKRKIPVVNFAERYRKDQQYKQLVIKQLDAMIQADVSSVSLNPVFGALWRAVCNDRDNPARDDLLASFSLHVDRLVDADEKLRMKKWLEESYDYASEIMGAIGSVPENQRFPCVLLDPTITFQRMRSTDQESGSNDDADRPITTLRRDELLEIGRSCDGRILHRLSKVLTRLTFVKSAADLPAHIVATSAETVPRIPLVLASREYDVMFWKILLHLVVPGTLLSARPATVLAALAIRIGIKPLFEPACAAMMYWRDKWNNLEVPETWNSSCLFLLLDADQEYRNQVLTNENDPARDRLLLDADRDLFSRLIFYHHTGANLLTTLTAEVGWTPQKTKLPLGPVVVCRGCKFPRSVSIMAEKSGRKCGLCLADDWRNCDHQSGAMFGNVSKDDNEKTVATWVECSVRTCRAQYVCYNPSYLNVRPKCHYCRIQTKLPVNQRSNDPAPTLECIQCLSKIIWPKEFRNTRTAPYTCIACLGHHETIVTIDTHADQLCKENGQSWLLRNEGGVLLEPFKRSLFHTISAIGVESFRANVEALPEARPDLVLTLRGKRIRNQARVLEQLRSWVQRRAAEKTVCSLCFNAVSKKRLLPACRRRGCHQCICEDCLNGWYGLNSRGAIINTAALFCPFCRRPPAARTLAAYGKGIHAVGDVRQAAEDRGRWIYAWCYDCGKARRCMQRECAQGAPPQMERWKCEECVESDLERARGVEEEARQALQRAAILDTEERIAAQRRLQDTERARKELERHVKECPGCKVPTQKIAGCDHITCEMPNCGVDWCWACREKFDSREIYRHMSKAHGGWYTGSEGIEFDGED
ncbi:hypothetical protein FB567DRAFT_537168 [Paraphoma chrysanthemicola]|uniref:RBR-type E3 ubiquitin transferase n=1 Tax=Paraphoma chrysanthemicola TaxID=798071 RepID=A0A8K0QVK4_9PLEO|nr:hypothetical protein FB567DRAFT_537168 [Paraphoma chrysanthemicola]